MRRKTLTLAVAAFLAIGASGAVAASMTTSPSPTTPSSAPADDAQPANYTVDVVDPDDELSDDEVEQARRIAWANDAVSGEFDDESVHFEVWAPVTDEDEISVWVAANETAPTRVIADVDLDDESVTDTRQPAVASAGEMTTLNVTATNASSENVTVVEATEGTIVFNSSNSSGSE